MLCSQADKPGFAANVSVEPGCGRCEKGAHIAQLHRIKFLGTSSRRGDFVWVQSIFGINFDDEARDSVSDSKPLSGRTQSDLEEETIDGTPFESPPLRARAAVIRHTDTDTDGLQLGRACVPVVADGEISPCSSESLASPEETRLRAIRGKQHRHPFEDDDTSQEQSSSPWGARQDIDLAQDHRDAYSYPRPSSRNDATTGRPAVGSGQGGGGGGGGGHSHIVVLDDSENHHGRSRVGHNGSFRPPMLQGGGTNSIPNRASSAPIRKQKQGDRVVGGCNTGMPNRQHQHGHRGPVGSQKLGPDHHHRRGIAIPAGPGPSEPLGQSRSTGNLENHFPNQFSQGGSAAAAAAAGSGAGRNGPAGYLPGLGMPRGAPRHSGMGMNLPGFGGQGSRPCSRESSVNANSSSINNGNGGERPNRDQRKPRPVRTHSLPILFVARCSNSCSQTHFFACRPRCCMVLTV